MVWNEAAGLVPNLDNGRVVGNGEYERVGMGGGIGVWEVREGSLW